MFALFSSWPLRPPALQNFRVVGCAFGLGTRQCKDLRRKKVAFVFLTCCLLVQSQANGQVKEVRRVVVFYELGHASPAVALIEREMRASLEDSPYQIELYNDYLETTLFDDPAA